MTATPCDTHSPRGASLPRADRTIRTTPAAAGAPGARTGANAVAPHRSTALALVLAGCALAVVGALVERASLWLVMPGIACVLVGLSFGTLVPPRRGERP